MAVVIALLGCLLVGLSSLLFFPDTPRIPVLSEGDWPVLIVMYLGAGWSLLGTVQYLRFGKGFMGKSALVLLMLGTLGGAGGMSYFVLSYSYKLPAAVELAEKPTPRFELTDQNGETHSDVSLQGKPYVLMFSRGVW